MKNNLKHFYHALETLKFLERQIKKINMNEKLSKIINKYKINLIEINKELEKFPYETIFNNQLLNQTNPEKLKGIIVMDNPGDEEKIQGQYLVGQAGKVFNKELTSIGITREEVLVFNKSAITTHGTNNLCEIYKTEELKEIFLKEQHITFNTIKEISLILDLPVMVHGYASYLKKGKSYTDNEKGNRPLYIFFKHLQENQEEMKKNTHFYKHSSYGNLSKQIKAHCRLLEKETLTFKEYLDLGKANCEGFFKE